MFFLLKSCIQKKKSTENSQKLLTFGKPKARFESKRLRPFLKKARLGLDQYKVGSDPTLLLMYIFPFFTTSSNIVSESGLNTVTGWPFTIHDFAFISQISIFQKMLKIRKFCLLGAPFKVLNGSIHSLDLGVLVPNILLF